MTGGEGRKGALQGQMVVHPGHPARAHAAGLMSKGRGGVETPQSKISSAGGLGHDRSEHKRHFSVLIWVSNYYSAPEGDVMGDKKHLGD